MHIKNSILVLTKIAPFFPLDHKQGETLERSVVELLAVEKREDLTILAQGCVSLSLSRFFYFCSAVLVLTSLLLTATRPSSASAASTGSTSPSRLCVFSPSSIALPSRSDLTSSSSSYSPHSPALQAQPPSRLRPSARRRRASLPRLGQPLHRRRRRRPRGARSRAVRAHRPLDRRRLTSSRRRPPSRASSLPFCDSTANFGSIKSSCAQFSPCGRHSPQRPSSRLHIYIYKLQYRPSHHQPRCYPRL